MKDVANCLNHRYKVVDELISEITDRTSGGIGYPKEIGDSGIKLMCRFWNILKENPDCNLEQAVKEKMGLLTPTGFRPPRRVTCYLCTKKDESSNDKSSSKPNTSAPISNKPSHNRCHATSSEPNTLPLSKALGNLKEAASIDKNCAVKVKDLEGQQQTLEEQIRILEQREKDGVVLLKKAECMWSCLEDSYKQKVAESLDTHKILLKQLMEVENSSSKWRKNKKDLELQLLDVEKIHRDIKEKINVKTNDLQLMESEKKSLSQRATSAKLEAGKAKALLEKKKQAVETKETNAKEKIAELEKVIKIMKKLKLEKEKEGTQYIKEARDELQKLNRALVQKKVENSVLVAQKEEMLADCEMYKNTYDECRNKCQSKKERLKEEIKKIEDEIASLKIKCLKCHECTDTVDLRKLCNDCPRCLQEKDCLLQGEYCEADPSMDCVCMKIKLKLMDNVLENMYTVLERQSSSKSGKVVADAILNSLSRSMNGKLDCDARKMVRDFVLSTVQKNLNLTVIGGAVKTRCEMDTATYNQLMNCLKDIKVTKPLQEDKQIASRRGPCRRWGGSHDCNCPSGPKDCICSRKAPPAPNDKKPSQPPEKDNEETVVRDICPHSEKELPCGPDCAQHNIPGSVGAEVSSWRPKPCAIQSCTFPKNMKAAQCFIGADGHADYIDKRRSSQLTNRILQIEKERPMHCHCTTSPCICSSSTSQVRVMQSECNKRTCAFKNYTPQKASKEKLDKTFSTAVYKGDLRTKFPTNSRLAKRDQFISAPKKIKQNVPFHELKNSNKVPLLVSVPEHHASTDYRSMKPKEKSRVNPFEEIEVIKTSSGSLSVMLDEDLVSKLEKITKDDREVFASLNESLSGRFFLSIETEPTKYGKRHVNLIKTPSGSTFLKLEKLGSNDRNNSKDVSCKSIQYSSSDWDQSQHHNEREKIKIILLESEKYNKINVKRVGIQYSSSDWIQSEDINVRKQTKQSGTAFKKDIDSKDKDIGIQYSSPDRNQSEPSEKKEQTFKNFNESQKYFKVRGVKGVRTNLNNLPIVLKYENAGNYEAVLDKEFEKEYKKSIQCNIKNDYQCVIGMTVTESQTCVIDFKPDQNKQNALLFKTQSGNIKILVQDPPIESLNSVVKACSSECGHLLSLLGSSHKTSSTNHKYNRFAKSVSDSCNISERSRARINDDIAFDLVSLRKTPSGSYSAVLNKESKKELLKSIKAYLSKKSVDFIPVKRSKSGNVTILVDENAQNEVKFTALKITESGNIFLVVDDGVLENKPSLLEPIHMATSKTATRVLKEPEEMAGTSFDGRPGIGTPDNDCTTSTSCSKFSKKNRRIRKCIAKNDKPQENPDHATTCTCSGNCCSYEKKGEPPNTYYSPTRRCTEMKDDSVEHCFCVYDSVSRIYESKCDVISNEISGIFSEMYSSSLKNSEITPTNQNNAEFHNLVWDSIEVMPFQLPLFLKENHTER